MRVILTTGVNCADRGVSRQTNTFRKGWPWLLNAGTARYTGTHFDGRLGWNVVDAGGRATSARSRRSSRTPTSPRVTSSARWPTTSSSTTTARSFSVDPRVATLMKDGGLRRRHDRFRPHDELGLHRPLRHDPLLQPGRDQARRGRREPRRGPEAGGHRRPRPQVRVLRAERRRWLGAGRAEQRRAPRGSRAPTSGPPRTPPARSPTS